MQKDFRSRSVKLLGTVSLFFSPLILGIHCHDVLVCFLSPEVQNSGSPTYALWCGLLLYFAKVKCHDGIFRLVNFTIVIS